MRKRLYPRDVVQRLAKTWDPNTIFPNWPPVPLPEPKVLTTLLDVCYNASLLTEEGRPVTFRVALLNEGTRIKFHDAHPATYYGFASHQPTARRDPMLREFQLWELTVHDDRSAVLTCRRDSGTGQEPMIRQEIEFTDFPLPYLKLYVEGGVLLLPSEH